jgi:hypothetical protein
MAINCTNNFHGKTLQNLSKLWFLVWKYAIWQPWSANVIMEILKWDANGVDFDF